MQEDKDWFDKALEYLDDENYSQAIVAIKKYVVQNPKNKRGKLLKAIIYGDLSNYNLVLQILEEIKPTEEDDKEYSKLYFAELADTFKEKGNYQEALKWYDKMIKVIPNETVGYILKGACLASAGKYELAKAEHLMAIKMEGAPEEAFYNLALISRAEMKFEEAKEYCEKSLAIDPNDKKVIHCYEDILEAIKMTKKK
jgi:tetratricopeptide (TPR) repeat protein